MIKLNRLDFDKLNITQQISYFNSSLELGKSMTSICKEISIPKSTWQDRIKREGFIYDKENKKYVKNSVTNKSNENVISSSNESKKSVITENTEVEKSNENVIEQIEIKNGNGSITLVNPKDLLELLQAKTEIMKMLSEYKKAEQFKNIIEIPALSIDVSKFKGKAYHKTFKVYPSVLDEFNKFIEQYPNYKQQDILAQLILEGIENYRIK